VGQRVRNMYGCVGNPVVFLCMHSHCTHTHTHTYSHTQASSRTVKTLMLLPKAHYNVLKFLAERLHRY